MGSAEHRGKENCSPPRPQKAIPSKASAAASWGKPSPRHPPLPGNSGFAALRDEKPHKSLKRKCQLCSS